VACAQVEESVTSVEPKQRGRFKIVAEQGGEVRAPAGR
jgi:serine/threonine-protein kinase OSR1/STK39